MRNVVNNRLGKKDVHHFVACVETNGQSVATFAAAAEQMPQVLLIMSLRKILGLKAPPRLAG